MAPLDAAFGASQNTVNTLLPELFEALKPTGLFSFDVTINEAGFKSVHVEFTQSPTVDFTPPGIPGHVSEAVSNGITNAPAFRDLDEDAKNAVVNSTLAAVSNINFDIITEGIHLQINYSDSNEKPLGLTAKIVLTTLVDIDASISPSIRFQAESGIVTTNKPDLDDIINSAIVPYIRTKINNDILKPMSLPVLGFDGISVAVPVAQIANKYLLAYTSLGIAPPDFPTGSIQWPANGAFIAVSPALVTSLAQVAISEAASSLPHTSFSEGPFTGDVGLTLGNLQDVGVLEDGSLSATASARAGANITFHTPWPLPNFSFGPVASGTVGIQARASVKNDQVMISNLGIGKFDLSIDWGGIPGWVSTILNPLLGPLEDYLFDTLIKPIVKDLLAPLVIPVYTIPTISIPVEGGKVTISLTGVDTGRLVVENRSLLIAYGNPVIS